ncbi:YlbF family regulator [Caldibacillus thermolactis]|jgi:cell fate (sporulation/competence/biofilm development) regulator YlbF (YheA/YmcA/DUF963 family)|uniref:UPF0342 protein OEV82_12870 n=1 Tax=Pallidibacillus thermolactis TaxID=251051 RepID=A0ABT2WKU5_9BACI|nr:YlbF family regulator [Pallidibacillus thermolactis]MCU9595334.1 YlbF family regulator [Pallidibacillus thermolactis]MCU9602652.1 YlbF family regulator [Pallidibacillus thermolactis subsp. kokeshiiformis]MED1672853.1 YlbF family regulator [Pallidibacillus thermolactis subsp. kokeshiiformis]
MATNILDSAKVLEQTIRESAEFIHLKQQYDNVYADEATKKIFDDFRNMQLNLQTKQMQGEQITQEEVMQAQQQVMAVQQNEKIAALLEAEQQMSNVIQQINKIVMKPLEELYND